MGKIKIGVIGCGKIAQQAHLPAYDSFEDVDIIALSSRDKEKLKILGQKYKVEKLYSDWREMLELEKLEGVSICTPTYLHSEIAVEAAKAGKHILVEKPIAMNLEEADEMIKFSKENKVILMINQTLRFSALFEKVKEILNQGILGKIYNIRAFSGHGGGKYWNPDAKWFYEKEKGGSVSLDLGIHEVDLFRWLTGKEIKKVSAFVANLSGEGTGDDNSAFIFQFRDGTIATLMESYTYHTGSERSVAIQCEKGIIKIESDKEKLITIKTDDSQGKSHPEIPPNSKYGPGRSYRCFINCIERKEKPSCTGEEGRASLEVIIAGFLSAKTNKAIELPLSE